MSTVDYIPNSTGGGALVMSQPDYITNAPTGVVPGLAQSTFQNKTVRQSSMIAAAVANFVSATLGIDVLDDGNISNLISELTSAIQVSASTGVAIGMNAPTNLRIVATEGSNNLTIAVKGTNGSDPSATNPVTIPFRDATIATGDLVARQITGALSFTINSGSTMGVVSNGQPFRLWVFAMDNAGTVLLGAVLCSTTSRVFPLSEDVLQTATGTNGGSTAGALYANAAASSKAIRVLGYVEFANGLASVGVWATAFTTIQLSGPGQKKPGDKVQISTSSSTTTATTSSATFAALASGATVAITPTSVVNLVRVKASGTMKISASNVVAQLQLVRGSTLIGNPAEMDVGTGVGALNGQVSLDALDAPASVSAQTYSYQGKTSGGTVSYPPASTGVYLEVEEIMG